MEQRTRSAAPTPAGTVVDVPRLAGGLVADQRTGLVVVGTHHPGRLLLLDGRTGAVVSRLPLQGNPGQLALAAVRDTRSPDGSAIWSSPSASWVGTSSGPPAAARASWPGLPCSGRRLTTAPVRPSSSSSRPGSWVPTTTSPVRWSATRPPASRGTSTTVPAGVAVNAAAAAGTAGS